MKALLIKLYLSCSQVINFLTPSFVTPNMITMMRIFLATLLLYLIYFLESDRPLAFMSLSKNSIILIIYVIGVISDFWDGCLARFRQLESSWGKKLDAIADKIFLLVLIFLLYNFNKFIFTSLFVLQLITATISLLAYFEGRQLSVNLIGRIFISLVFLGFFLLLLEVNYSVVVAVFYCTIPLSLINIGILAKYRINAKN